VPEVVCAGCGAVCDDVTVDFATLAVEPRCPLAERWFSAQTAAGPDATAGGETIALDTAVERVAALLRESRRPLVDIAGATVETASAAIALAEQLGAVVAGGGGSPAVALRGASTATFGEIRDRARVVIVWQADPETTHPRLLERLRLPADGRTLVVVSELDTPTAERADVRLRLPLGAEPLMTFDDELLGNAPNAAFLHTLEGRDELALHELVRRLSADRHVTTLRLGGARGADDTLAWQTGYAGTVDLGAGHPERAGRIDPDVVLRVESAAIAVDDIEIRTAFGGTVHRMDGVPLTLPTVADRPKAEAILTRLQEAL
jgi:formylmethanofuran dehydrogenase subunit B